MYYKYNFALNHAEFCAMWKSLSEVLCVLFDRKINILSREELNMISILFNFPVKRCVSCSLSGIFAGKGLSFNIYVHDYKMKAGRK